MRPIVRSSRQLVALVLGLLVLAAWSWLSDFVTIQGESTIYTAECRGAWQGGTCAGELAAGPRYRFRALPRRGEVLFWTLGRPEPSGRFTQCVVQDGRNWTCPPGADAGRTITLSLVQGRAAHDATGKAMPFRAIAKWRWLLLRWGVPVGQTATG